MSRYLMILGLFLLSLAVEAEEQYCFRVYLTDKGTTSYRVDCPEAYLSSRAIARRAKQGVVLSPSDLPISRAYIDSLAAVGGRWVTESRWFSTVVVACSDSLVVNRLQALSFVDSVQWVWKGESATEKSVSPLDTAWLLPSSAPLKSHYGYAENQIKMLNGIKLHEQGFRGKGMEVAVIDAGFRNVDRLHAFRGIDIKGTRNFVFPGTSVYTDDEHGTKVLSCLAANLPGVMVGTAPEAAYWLLKSEDNRSEYPIEEDYWVAAVEFADSVGVDVISSSLGYYTYDSPQLVHPPSALDGRTTLITRAASAAAEKGILLFSSAGNEGNGDWGKITFPSDAPDVVTVGSVTEKKKRSIFSSVGLTADYRVKPDVVALGTDCCVIDELGEVCHANGTSFATPTLAGLAICLWQALPEMSNRSIIHLLLHSANQYKQPDAELGYGIPDMHKAYKNRANYVVQFTH